MQPTSLARRSPARVFHNACPHLAAWVLLFCALIFSRPGAASASEGHLEAERDLEKIEHDWGRLIQGNVANTIGSFLAVDFQYVDAAGLVKARPAYLKEMEAGALRIESYRIEKMTTRVFGDTAVVATTVGIIGQDDKRDISAFYQTTDTFLSRKGKWMAVSRQQTKIASRKDPLFEQLGKPDGEPRVVVFVLGSFCPHCMSQLLTFATELSLRKINVTVVSADSEADLKKFRDLPYKLVADPKHELFRKFGAYQEKPMHATLVLDGEGTVIFRHVGASPYMDAKTVALWAWVGKASGADANSAVQGADQSAFRAVPPMNFGDKQ